MEKYLFHTIDNHEYSGILTILDYEIRISAYLSELVLPSYFKGKKTIVDLALKAGVDQYRFVAYDVDDAGRVIMHSNHYVEVSPNIEKMANNYLKQKKEVVLNSFLTETQKNNILK